MGTDTITAPICQHCGNEIPYDRRRGRPYWLARTHCNRTCASRSHQHPTGVVSKTLAALIEDAEWLLDPFGPRGTRYELAKRLGYDNPESLARRFHRAGRKDLANAFDAECKG